MPSADDLIKRMNKRRSLTRRVLHAVTKPFRKVLSPTGLSDDEIRAMFGPREAKLPDGTVKRWVPLGPVVEVTSKNGKMVQRELKEED